MRAPLLIGLLVLLAPAAWAQAPCPAASTDIRGHGAAGDGASRPADAAWLAALPSGRGGDYRAGDERDAVALQEALHEARAAGHGTVCLPAGRYLIDRAAPAHWPAGDAERLAARAFTEAEPRPTAAVWFEAMAGARLVGAGAAETRIATRGPGDLAWLIAPPPDAGGVAMRDLGFDDVGLILAGEGGGRRLGPLSFERLAFRDGPSQQLRLLRVEDARVTASEFHRSYERASRALSLWKSHRVTVEDSRFTGFIATAVNVSGADGRDPANHFGPFDPDERSREVVIRGNLMARDPAAEFQDHGVYVWGADGVEIVGNAISGWESSASGTAGARYSGAIKLRNGERAKILDNDIRDTGILLYTYDSEGMPRYLRDVLVAGNSVVVEDGWFDHCQYKGIAYWKNFETVAGDRHEDRIEIRDNRIEGGCLWINGERADLSAFAVTGNTASEFRFLIPGWGWGGLEDAAEAGDAVFGAFGGNRPAE